jgi:beta-xylosidase
MIKSNSKLRAVYTVIFLFIISSLAAQSQKHYLFSYFMGNGEDGLHLAHSSDGLRWEALNDNQSFLQPQVGNDKLMRDPCIIQTPDSMFHMVWTVSWKEKSIGYASSEDLINWSEQQAIPVMEHEPDALNCWAPEIFFDEDKGLFIIIWSTTIPGRFPETETSGDNGHNHRMYYTTTKDFSSYSDTRLFYDKGFNVIDGTLLKTNEEYILFLKDETRYPPQKNIRISRSKNLTGGYGPASTPITGDYWAEGPTAIKIGEYWYVYFDKYRKHQMGAVRSTDLVNWEDVSHLLRFPKGTRHGSIFVIDEVFFAVLKEFE